MPRQISVNLPADLPENWTDTQYVSPEGIEVGLTEKHGYNYLMKQVNNAQTAILELADAPTAAHENLLDNWDFRNPIDTRATYVVPPGTTLYEDSKLSVVCTDPAPESYLEGRSYSSGVVYVSQGDDILFADKGACFRGYARGSSDEMSINRWALTGGGDSDIATMRFHDDGIQLSLRPYSQFTQKVWPARSLQWARGKKLTLSANVVNISGGTATLVVQSGSSLLGEVDITSAGMHTVTVTVPENAADALQVGVFMQSSGVVTMKLSAMKLELGESSTLAEDSPANYAEQNAVCMQYSAINDAYVGLPQLSTANTYVEASLSKAVIEYY